MSRRWRYFKYTFVHYYRNVIITKVLIRIDDRHDLFGPIDGPELDHSLRIPDSPSSHNKAQLQCLRADLAFQEVDTRRINEEVGKLPGRERAQRREHAQGLGT